jgi:DNA-binding response OmpR family regulator
MDGDTLEIRAAEHDAFYQGVPLHLTDAEFRLLTLLAENAGRALSRVQIIETLHGTRYASTVGAVDVLVWALRKKLGPAAGRVQAVRGIGYRFQPTPEPPQ